MKLKKFLIGATLASCAAVALASCGDSKEDKPAVITYVNSEGSVVEVKVGPEKDPEKVADLAKVVIEAADAETITEKLNTIKTLTVNFDETVKGNGSVEYLHVGTQENGTTVTNNYKYEDNGNASIDETASLKAAYDLEKGNAYFALNAKVNKFNYEYSSKEYDVDEATGEFVLDEEDFEETKVSLTGNADLKAYMQDEKVFASLAGKYSMTEDGTTQAMDTASINKNGIKVQATFEEIAGLAGQIGGMFGGSDEYYDLKKLANEEASEEAAVISQASILAMVNQAKEMYLPYYAGAVEGLKEMEEQILDMGAQFGLTISDSTSSSVTFKASVSPLAYFEMSGIATSDAFKENEAAIKAFFGDANIDLYLTIDTNYYLPVGLEVKAPTLVKQLSNKTLDFKFTVEDYYLDTKYVTKDTAKINASLDAFNLKVTLDVNKTVDTLTDAAKKNYATVEELMGSMGGLL